MLAKKNPLSEEAFELYKSGMKLVDIAAKIGKPEGTVRRWKSTYKWDGERSDKKANVRIEEKDLIDDGTKETLQNESLTPERQLFCLYYSKTFNATQSYQKAYGCKYSTALTNGPALLGNTRIKKEIERLKEIKRQQIVAGAEDIVELQMRIAFADIGDYVNFGREKVAIMGPFGPIKDAETGEVLEKEINSIRLNESDMIDTQLIQEVKQGRDGVSIKLADRQKALDFLTKFFEMNPDDKHRKEFDKRKLELELIKMEMKVKEKADDIPEPDNFLDALNESAKEVWKDG